MFAFIFAVDYEVRVTTGELPMAGTDSNVFITLYGKEAASPRTKLKGKSRDNDKHPPFHRGKTDTFNITIDDVGPLTKIM